MTGGARLTDRKGAGKEALEYLTRELSEGMELFEAATLLAFLSTDTPRKVVCGCPISVPQMLAPDPRRAYPMPDAVVELFLRGRCRICGQPLSIVTEEEAPR